jgi:hypothetical protein
MPTEHQINFASVDLPTRHCFQVLQLGFGPVSPLVRHAAISSSDPELAGRGWSWDHALSLAYFSKINRLYSACTAFREICPFRSLAIFKRSGSVGARDFRLNLAKNLVAGPGVLPNRLSNNPIVSSLVRDMFREPLYSALGIDGYFPDAFSPISAKRRPPLTLREATRCLVETVLRVRSAQTNNRSPLRARDRKSMFRATPRCQACRL